MLNERCREPDCQKRQRARGLCSAHYSRQYRLQKAERDARTCQAGGCRREVSPGQRLCHPCTQAQYMDRKKARVGAEIQIELPELSEEDREWCDGVMERISAEFRALMATGTTLEDAAEQVGIENLEYARELVIADRG